MGGETMNQMMEPQMQEPMMQEPMMQPQGIMQAPLEGMESPQSQIDPTQALEIIIQMLIAQGIPPEQARQVALQMVQAVAEGGIEEMSDERVEARFGGRIEYAGGGIGNLINRQGYFVGSIAKAISGAVKGVTGAVKSVVKSPIGKAALTVAALYAAGGGFSPEGFSFFGTPGSTAGGLLGAGGKFGLGQSFLGQTFGPLIPSGISSLIPGKGTLLSLGAGILGGSLAGAPPQQQPGELNEDYQARVNQYKAQYAPLLNPTIQYPGNPFYTQMAADGGRIGYQGGGIGDLISQVTKQEFFGTPMMANGGRMQYAMGAEVPTRQNQVGITELDYRKTGGFVPPIGIKEKADDIPAMLSNNEFVFTADAVRNAGGGNVNKGAERMYSLMKNLEAGGRA